MAINLSKGQSVNLEKDSGLDKIIIGLGWNPQTSKEIDFDLDASIYLLNIDEKCSTDENFIFYGNTKTKDGSVVHTGDNKVGLGSDKGDAEQIKIDFKKMSTLIESIPIVVSIYDAHKRRQNFGMVNNSYVRIFDLNKNKELCRFELNNNAQKADTIIFGILYRKDKTWNFKALEQEVKGGLANLCKNYGLEVA